MKKFLTTLFLYFLIVGSITVAINGAYLMVAEDDVTERFLNVPDQIQISTFGSSHGECGFDYEDVTDKICFNFSLTAQFPSYDYRLMRYYGDKLAAGGTAYLVVSYFSLFGIDETKTETFASKNARYYSFLPPEYIKEYDWKTSLFAKYFPSMTQGEDLLLIFMQRSATTETDNRDRTVNTETLEHDAHDRSRAHLIVEKLDNSGARIRNQEEITSLYEMISFCRERDVEPVLVTTPFLAEYSDAVMETAPGFLEEFHDIIREITTTTGVRYYDYSADSRFIHDYSLFMNSDHLNRTGARKFTNLLLQETLQS